MKENKTMYLLIAFAMLIVLLIVIAVGNSNPGSTKGSPAYAASDSTAMLDSTKSEEAPEETKAVWNFDEKEDDMYGTKNIWATIYSTNYADQDFPYDPTRASICVRYMKKYGVDVIIGIESGQIVGNEFQNTNFIRAKFDNGTPIKYYFTEPADYSSDNVFITKSRDFIKRCKQANDIILEIPLYEAGRPTFKFHVDEKLKWDK